MDSGALVLDTNVFVAAGFNEASHSARLIRALKKGHLRLMWDEDTLAETRSVLSQIPPLNWSDFEDLFKPENLVPGTDLELDYSEIEDPSDRKFAALADRLGLPLISNDDHFLSVRESLDVTVLTPREAIQKLDT